MWRGVRLLVGSTLAIFLLVPAVLASPDSVVATDHSLAIQPPVRALTALEPASAVEAAPISRELRPVQMARVPFSTLSNATLLPASVPTIGYRSAAGGANRHVQWTLLGAGVGLFVGLLANEVMTGTLIGAGAGFGLSFVY